MPKSPNKTSRASSPDVLNRSPYFGQRNRQFTPSHFFKHSDSRPFQDDPDVLPTLATINSLCGGEERVAEESSDMNDLLQQLSLLKPQLIQGSTIDTQDRLLQRLLPPEIVATDPWKLLVAVTLLNKTSGKLAIPIFWEILGKWPSARHLSNAALPELLSILQRIGTQTVRAKRLIALSAAYLSDPPSVYDPRPPRGFMGSPTHRNSNKRTSYLISGPISHLPGVGPYALDSYRIFCTVYEDPTSQEWKQVQPTDKQLSLYLKWKWAAEEHKQWCPVEGVIGDVTPSYILSLIEELEHKLSP